MAVKGQAVLEGLFAVLTAWDNSMEVSTMGGLNHRQEGCPVNVSTANPLT
jgi:hypothetical protein